MGTTSCDMVNYCSGDVCIKTKIIKVYLKLKCFCLKTLLLKDISLALDENSLTS